MVTLSTSPFSSRCKQVDARLLWKPCVHRSYQVCRGRGCARVCTRVGGSRLQCVLKSSAVTESQRNLGPACLLHKLQIRTSAL